MRLGVATVWDGKPKSRFACGVLMWCQSAERLLAAVSSITAPIILGTDTPFVDCPRARYLLPNVTITALLRYSTARRSKGALVNLLKIHLFALYDLDVVLFSDLDVDVAPPKPLPDKWLQWWHAGISTFMRSPALVTATPDHEAPLNTALMLIKPNRRLYEMALGVFHDNVSFDPKTGFNGVGTPRALIDSPTVLDKSKLMLLASGFGMKSTTNQSTAKAQVMERLRKTRAYRLNAWTFAAGAIDQGLFFLLALIMAPAATWAENACRCPRRPWTVAHYWGPNKPWRPVAAEYLTTRTGGAVRYLRNLPNYSTSDTTASRSACYVELMGLVARIKSKGAWNEKVAKHGRRSIHFQAILPSRRLENFTFMHSHAPAGASIVGLDIR